jgi:hypothetical protein
MAEAEKTTAKKPQKGGRKGGTLFPKISLKQSIDYSKRLVSKTHTGPQPASTILPGVFGNSGNGGKVRASALKQFGLLEGAAEAYKATQLAKDIDAALEQDRSPLLQRAFLSSKLFNHLFQTFHGDSVSKAKIEQRARGLDVHPESSEECAQLFIESAVTATLGRLEGDSLRLLNSAELKTPSETPTSEDESEESETVPEESNEGSDQSEEKPAVEHGADHASTKATAPSGKPNVSLNLNVDPSSDPDKLEKQLKLLRKYGMI